MHLPPYWNDDLYLSHYPDVKQAVTSGNFTTGWNHYKYYGCKEGRIDGYQLTEQDIQHHNLIKSSIKNLKTNYVIAVWSGDRRDNYKPYKNDPSHYLRAQIDSLVKNQHDLQQITIVVAHNPKEPVSFSNYLNSIPNTINSTKVSILHRDNYGQSYGSYSHAFYTYKKQFDYYIFIEDDYVFIKDNFDLELITYFKSAPNCGFLCSLVSGISPDNSAPLHASISNGITSYEVLEKIWEKFGRIPHDMERPTLSDDIKYSGNSQLSFSSAFLDAGYNLYDLTFKYQAPFVSVTSDRPNATLRTYAPHKKEQLIIPVQKNLEPY